MSRDSSSFFRIAPVAGQRSRHGGGKSRYGLAAATRRQSSAFARPGRVRNPVRVAFTEPHLNGQIARRSTLQLSLGYDGIVDRLHHGKQTRRDGHSAAQSHQH